MQKEMAMNKKLIGLLMITIGISIIIAMCIPEEAWAFLVAALAITLGLMLIKC